MIDGLVNFCHQFLQISYMYTKTVTSSEQCFKGTFIIFIEDPKSTFVRSVNLFVRTFVAE